LLQYWRVIANLRRFPQRLVDNGIEGNTTPDEVAPKRLRVGKPAAPSYRQMRPLLTRSG
jgi:hypothetical protein